MLKKTFYASSFMNILENDKYDKHFIYIINVMIIKLSSIMCKQNLRLITFTMIFLRGWMITMADYVSSIMPITLLTPAFVIWGHWKNMKNKNKIMFLKIKLNSFN